jgi:hypothetical protein
VQYHEMTLCIDSNHQLILVVRDGYINKGEMNMVDVVLAQSVAKS